MKFNNAIPAITIILWSIIGLYFGTGALVSTKEINDYQESKKIKNIVQNVDSSGVIYDGLYFRNLTEMENFIKDEKYANVITLFDWSSRIPDFLILIIGACSFGLIGTIMKILYEHIFSITLLSSNKYISLPFFGFLTGFLSIGISYLLPGLFLESKALINPVALILFSMLFGFFSKEFTEKIAHKLF